MTMKARGITVAWSQNLQNLAMYTKGKGLLMTKRKALDFCKVFPKETIFYWEEKQVLEGETRGIRFILKKATFK